MSESTAAQIRERLTVLAPQNIQVIDDSARHAGHAGAASGGGHYRLEMVSERFAGLPRLARHRLVYDALAPLMKGEIHALSMNLQTPADAGF